MVCGVSSLLVQLLDKPRDFRESVKRTVASMGSIMFFGHRAPEWEGFWAHVNIAMFTMGWLTIELAGWVSSHGSSKTSSIVKTYQSQ